MKRNVIILSKIKKAAKINNGRSAAAEHGLHIIGIDADSGAGIRLLPFPGDEPYIIPYKNAKFSDGSEAEVLDKVEIEFADNKSDVKIYGTNLYSDEICLYDDKTTWKKIGTATLQDVLALVPADSSQNILGDRSYKFTGAAVPGRSWTLLKMTNLCIKVEESRSGGTQKNITVSFDYNDHTYRFFKVYDPELTAKYNNSDIGDYPIEGERYGIIAFADPRPDAIGSEITFFKNFVKLF